MVSHFLVVLSALAESSPAERIELVLLPVLVPLGAVLLLVLDGAPSDDVLPLDLPLV